MCVGVRLSVWVSYGLYQQTASMTPEGNVEQHNAIDAAQMGNTERARCSKRSERQRCQEMGQRHVWHKLCGRILHALHFTAHNLHF